MLSSVSAPPGAGAGQARAHQVERLHIGRHGVAGRRHDGVGAAARRLGHGVAGVGDVIEVVAAEAGQRIHAADAEQRVGAARAGAGQPRAQQVERLAII